MQKERATKHHIFAVSAAVLIGGGLVHSAPPAGADCLCLAFNDPPTHIDD